MHIIIVLLLLLVSGPAFAQVNGVALNATAGVLLLGSPAGAANCKTATTGAIRYNSTSPAIEFCDGTNWTKLVGTQTSGGATPPVGSGFFVLSHDTHSGDLVDLATADATCLSDLTTYTGWKNYSVANGRGLLTSGHVHAFICDESTCNNLAASTTYYFANAGNSSAGGASFTTDGSGAGPNNSSNWSAANYFSGTYTYWADRPAGTATAWSLTPFSGSDYDTCAALQKWWFNGNTGNSANTGSARWYSSNYSCAAAYHIICYVNP